MEKLRGHAFTSLSDMLKLLIVVILFFDRNQSSDGRDHKLIFQKDLSEYCRRRVMPSIFLGRQVVNANARLLQFSRLELPYSCFISVRTQSGSNMVMVIQLTPDELGEACAKNNEQLLIYEMGETFGGYWGPLPDSVLKREPLPPKVYTLKTSRPSITVDENSPDLQETETTEATSKLSRNTSKASISDYIQLEVPLLNVSIHLEPGYRGTPEPVAAEESFDMRNDVTPIPGEEYDRRILPIVQFHMEKEPQRRQEGDGIEDEPPRYQLDVVQEFTPDLRLTLPPFDFSHKRRYSYGKPRYLSTKRLNFKKHRTLFYTQRHHENHSLQEKITRRMNNATKYAFPTKNTLSLFSINKNEKKGTENSWQVIKELVKKLDKTKERDESQKTTFSAANAMLLEKISDMQHNLSVYLSPNLSTIHDNIDTNKYTFTIKPKSSIWKLTNLHTKNTINKNKIAVTKRKTNITPPIKMIEDTSSIRNLFDKTSKNTKLANEISVFPKEIKTYQTPLSLASSSGKMLQMDVKVDDLVEKYDILENTTVSETVPRRIAFETASFKDSNKEVYADFNINNINKKILTGSMVGHESWENLVQAAPEMVILLNQTVPIYDDDNTNSETNNTTKEFNKRPIKDKLLKRKKRDIHSIAIENARPHNLTTKRAMDTTTQTSFKVADMQEFAQLVELKDDELQGRVALRYLRQYVGPALFNLCDLDASTIRHVHLFNSSKIVLAITNFTLNRMIIILTAARTLLNGELRCPKSQLECQVAGARVCLDSMVACDGVPNCGSYDIYDEDRLLCGTSVTLQHNVYLASFAFLAVLLTLLYAVHYWLKRCVPKVADAFFVYTDGIENILFLDSIMRSPNETTEEDPKMVFHSHMYGEENIMYDEDLTQTKKTACQRFLKKFCPCFLKQHNNANNVDTRFDQKQAKKMYSFTELEIRKMISSSKEIAVQTGASLEMKYLQSCNRPIGDKLEVKAAPESYNISLTIRDSLTTLQEPLPEEHKDELSLLKFFNKARSDSIASITKELTFLKESRDNTIELHEKEIRSHTYDRSSLDHPGPSKTERPSDPSKIKSHSKSNKKERKEIPSFGRVSKQLRFDEVTTTIPSVEYDDDDDEVSGNFDRRRSVALGESSWRSPRHLDTIEEGDEHPVGAKEHRHFWGTITGKKTKKRTLFNNK